MECQTADLRRRRSPLTAILRRRSSSPLRNSAMRICFPIRRFPAHHSFHYRHTTKPRRIANPAHGVAPARQLELLEHMVDMMLDSGHAQAEFFADLFIRETTANKFQHFAFPPS